MKEKYATDEGTEFWELDKAKFYWYFITIFNRNKNIQNHQKEYSYY